MARNVHIFARELCPLLGHPGIWHLKGSTLPKVDQSGRWYLETPPLSEATKDVVRLFNEMHVCLILNPSWPPLISSNKVPFSSQLREILATKIDLGRWPRCLLDRSGLSARRTFDVGTHCASQT